MTLIQDQVMWIHYLSGSRTRSLIRQIFFGYSKRGAGTNLFVSDNVIVNMVDSDTPILADRALNDGLERDDDDSNEEFGCSASMERDASSKRNSDEVCIFFYIRGRSYKKKGKKTNPDS